MWRADGYSLGDLLYSLPLGPGQKKQIAVVDWERRESARRDELTGFDESLSNLMVHDRDISEIVNVSLRENNKGSSSAFTGGYGQGSGAAGSGSYGGMSLGAVVGQAFGMGFGTSEASMSAARTLAADSLQKVRDTTFQAASAVRSLRSTVIHTVSQGEQVTVTTEVIANHNHCHAMTIQYFEVLRHFKVTQELGMVQECLFVPLRMTDFDESRALRWQDTLRARLRDLRLARAFDALRRKAVDWKGANFPDGAFADEPVRYVEGWFFVRIHVPKHDPGFFESLWNSFTSWIAGSTTNPVSNARLQILINGAPRNVAFTLISDFRADTPLYVRFRSTDDLGIRRRDIEHVTFAWDKNPEGFPDGSQNIIVNGTMRYYTDHKTGVLFADSNISAGASQDLQATLWCPPTTEDLRNPKDDDRQLVESLVRHLNEHVEHYHKAIW
ncbi:MAG TPA: hypothetical protein VK986_07885 [Tepidisphaeraceae bacterium]|nr:hypothetical protein [Tepidisphaeraceae bacterium]